MSSAPVSIMANDGGDVWIAANNCSFCAVGGLFNKSATEVMTRVFGLLGEAKPSGIEGKRCGEVWVRLYEKRTGVKVKLEGQGYLIGQLNGVREFVEACGCKVKAIGSVEKPLTAAQIVEEVKGLGDGTAFLLLTADDDGFGMAALAHWVCGQVKEKKPKFFDYQLKIPNADTRDFLSRMAAESGGKGFSQTQPYESDVPLSPWGVPLSKEDGRGVILAVTK